MQCFLIQFTPKRRRALGNSLTFLSFVQFLGAWTICLCSLYFERNLDWALQIIHGFGSQDFFSKLILACGLASLMVYMIGAKIYVDSGREATRSRFTTIFPLWNTILLLLLLTKVATISYCYWEMSTDLNSFREGFIHSVRNYMSERSLKEQMDYLQSEFKCCGADSFTDWMITPWIPEEYNVLKKFPERKSGAYVDFYKTLEISVGPDQLVITPYSCCDLNRTGPCIHDFTSQQSLSETVKYNWGLGNTLWKKGCAEVVKSVYDDFLHNFIRFAFFSFSFDVVTWILFQYLKSSVEMIELSANHEGISPGWLMTF